MQRLLLQIACLPRVTIDTARALSGDDVAARVLLNLAHNDYFVRELVGSEGRVFVFHPLLREFLLQRAARDLPRPSASTRADAPRACCATPASPKTRSRSLSSARIGRTRRRSSSRRPRCCSSRVGTQPSPAGSNGCPEALPPTARSSPTAPRFAHVSPRAARRKHEDAFEVFRRGDDRRGMARACRGVIDAILREFDDLAALDRWLGEFDRLELATRVDAAAPSAVIAARLWRNPTHPSVGGAAAGGVGEGEGDEGRALVTAAAVLLRGEFARSAAIAARIGDVGGVGRLTLIAAQALRLVLDGDSAAALEVARGGLQTSAADGIRVHDAWLHLLCAAAALGLDDVETARAALDRVDAMPQRRGDRAFAHHLRGWLARATGSSAATRCARRGMPCCWRSRRGCRGSKDWCA